MKFRTPIIMIGTVLILAGAGFLGIKQHRVNTEVQQVTRYLLRTYGTLTVEETAPVAMVDSRTNEWKEFRVMDIPEDVREKWEFRMFDHDSITATSTIQNPIGSGKKITLDIQKKLCYGFGLPSIDKQQKSK
ncbi:hypothetical protein K8I28_05475 [bacterium]|nr:hypothetical protein [bacterium]